MSRIVSNLHVGDFRSDVISEFTVDGETSENVGELNDEIKMEDDVSGIGFIAISGNQTGIILEEVKYSH
eukprot:4666494-Ditylum_brightwellii.AAC.1